MTEKQSAMTAQLKKPSQLSQEAWDAVDVPEMTDKEFAEARPFAEVFPDAFQDRANAPEAARPKVRLGLRLAADVASAVKASGKNYHAKVEAILRAAILDGRL